MTTELKPCPFCGGTKLNDSHHNSVYCVNNNCGGGVEVHFGRHDHSPKVQKEEAHKVWNTRTPEAILPVADVEKAVNIMDYARRGGKVHPEEWDAAINSLRTPEASKADAGEVVDNEWFFRWAARAMADGRYQEAISTIFHHPANPYANNNPWEKKNDHPNR